MVKVTLDRGTVILFDRITFLREEVKENLNSADTSVWVLEGAVKPGQLVPPQVSNLKFAEDSEFAIRTIEFLP